MANTQVYEMVPPRSDTYLIRSGVRESYVAVEATDTATADPDGDTGYISTGETETVRLLVAYDGTVSSAALQVWLLQDGTWYRAGSTDLDPANGNESYEAPELGTHTQFAVQVSEISGGGTVEVSVLGVR